MQAADDVRVTPAQDHGPPRGDEVDELVAVGVPDMGSLGAGDEERLGHADALHRPHRRVDPAGDVLPSLVEEARRGLCLHSTLPGKISLPETFNIPVSYTHLRAHETRHDLVCR